MPTDYLSTTIEALSAMKIDKKKEIANKIIILSSKSNIQTKNQAKYCFNDQGFFMEKIATNKTVGHNTHKSFIFVVV